MAESKAKTAHNNHHHRHGKEIVLLNEEIAELQASEPSHSRSIYDKVYEQAERFATTSLGQYVIVRVDRLLKTIEETAKWSVPRVKSSPILPAPIPLERPLPWIPFLFLIIVLRLTRIWLSVGAVMIGNSPITAANMVYFIQVRRRKLRALRVQGLKIKQRREQESKALSTSNISQKSFIGKLRSLFSLAICQPGIHNLNRRVVVVHEGMFQEKENKINNQNKETVPKPINVDNDTDDDDDVGFEDDNSGHLGVHNMTVQEMLAKYAKESSADDSDFVPDEEESSEDDSETDDSEQELLRSNGVRKDRHNGNDNNYEKLHDDVKLIKENGGRFSNAVPLPFIEIKKEPTSDENSANEKRIRNGTKEHDSESVAAKNSKKIETPKQNASAKINIEMNVEQKSTPGHMSAAIASTRIFNNAATAASTNRRSTPIGNDNSNQVNEIDSNPSTNVVVAASGYSKDDPTPLLTSQTINDPVIPDPSSNILANLLEANSTSTTRASIEKCDNTNTITPGTSSEDLFYSPIGSPTEFSADFLPPSILKQSTVTSSAGNGAHSTPISEAETEENDLPAKKHVTLQNQQKQGEPQQQQHKQQQQHQQNQQPQKQKQQEEQQQQQQKHKQHEEPQQPEQPEQQQKHKQHEEPQQHEHQQQQQQQQQQEEQQHQQQQQHQKHNNFNNRYRGRNRR